MNRIGYSLVALVFWGTSTASELPRQIVVTAPAILHTSKDGWTSLTVADGTRTYTFPWGRFPHYSPTGIVSLKSNVVYTFTVLERESDLIPKELLLVNIPVREVIRVEQDGQLIWDREICEVHKVRVENRVVQVSYGYPVPTTNAPTWEEEERLFPHRFERAWGGCAVSPDSEMTRSQYVCEQCKEAFRKWALPANPKATMPAPRLPRSTRYDHDLGLRALYLASFREGYADAWQARQRPPVFGPTSQEDKARVLGYAEGALAGHAARAALLSNSNTAANWPTIPSRGPANTGKPRDSTTNPLPRVIPARR